jgi:hypothetical protein
MACGIGGAAAPHDQEFMRGRLGVRGLISGRFSAIKDSGVGTEKGRLGILQSPEESYWGLNEQSIPWAKRSERKQMLSQANDVDWAQGTGMMTSDPNEAIALFDSEAR